MDAPRSLLLVKPSSLGDIIHALPVLDRLHDSWPDTCIDWIVKPEWAALLDGHPMLRAVVRFPRTLQEWRRSWRELSRQRYDMVIDLQGLLRSGVLSAMTAALVRIGFANGREGSRWFYTHPVVLPSQTVHAVDRYLHVIHTLGVPSHLPRRFPLPNWSETEAWVEELWRQEGFDECTSVCLIHPAARWAIKRWPAERYAIVADRLVAEKGYRLILVGALSQIDQINRVSRLMQQRPINLAGQTTLPQLATLLRRATVLVTNDSGPMHLAAAVGTPVVAIFGPTDPRKIGPYGTGHTVLSKSIDCSPCRRQRCLQGFACLNAVGVDEVVEAVNRTVSGGRAGIFPLTSITGGSHGH